MKRSNYQNHQELSDRPSNVGMLPDTFFRRVIFGVATIVGVGAMVILGSSCGKKPADQSGQNAAVYPAPTAQQSAMPSAADPAANAVTAPVPAPAVVQPAVASLSFPVSLLNLTPKGAEYGTLPDPEKIQTDIGPGRIDTSPIRNNNNATWFWPKALKIVKELPPENFAFQEGQAYSSSMTDKFVSEGFFVTGVGLWARTRNMYHWIEYDIPQGAAKFSADVLIGDDVFGWFAGQKDKVNQQFTFIATVDGRQVARQGATRLGKLNGSGEKLIALDIPLPPGAKTIRFALEVTPWGAGNKNIELIVAQGTFKN